MQMQMCLADLFYIMKKEDKTKQKSTKPWYNKQYDDKWMQIHATR